MSRTANLFAEPATDATTTPQQRLRALMDAPLRPQCAGRRTSYRGHADIGADLRCQLPAAAGSRYCRFHQDQVPQADKSQPSDT